LRPYSKFFNFLEVAARYKPIVLKAFEITKQLYEPELTTIQIFGELFGGLYPNQKGLETTVFVQKGVYYCPLNDFYAFDIHNGKHFMDYNTILDIFEKAGFPVYAKPLFRGSFQDAMKFPNLFITKIPDYYNLPKLENNYAEGVVIRPIQSKHLPTGSRILFKNKIDAFSEVNPPKLKMKVPKTSTKKTPTSKSQALTQIAEDYINENRLNNVLSKMEQIPSGKEAIKLIGLLAKDALDEFKRDYEEEFKTLEPSEQKDVTKHVSAQCRTVVSKWVRKTYNDII